MISLSSDRPSGQTPAVKCPNPHCVNGRVGNVGCAVCKAVCKGEPVRAVLHTPAQHVPASPAPSLRELAERALALPDSMHPSWHDKTREEIVTAFQFQGQMTKVLLEAQVRDVTEIRQLRAELESTRSALREAQEAVEGWYADSVQAQYEVMFARFGDDADGDVRCGVANLSNANRIIRKVRAAAGSTTP